MLEFPLLPDDLPWEMPAYMLLDGVSVPDLPQRLLQWNNPTYGLYLDTRWHELSDISPRLISLQGSDDPLLMYFLEHAVLEWGYLLFSESAPKMLVDHWQNLLSVEQVDDVEVMPRIADPAVMHQLFKLAEQDNSARWFGPIAHVCLPDGVENTWKQHIRSDQAGTEPETYRLTDQELSALGEVEFRNVSSGLKEHLQTYFTEFMTTFTEPERHRYAQKIANDAYQNGFSSEQEITLYANVFGHLAGEPLSDHPDITQLLTGSTPDTPLVRVTRAAELAESRAADRQGSPL